MLLHSLTRALRLASAAVAGVMMFGCGADATSDEDVFVCTVRRVIYLAGAVGQAPPVGSVVTHRRADFRDKDDELLVLKPQASGDLFAVSKTTSYFVWAARQGRPDAVHLTGVCERKWVPRGP